jgi:D-alanine-D-alanine ligase
MKKTKVLLLFGGESPEHEVSLASAKNVYAAIDKKKYDVSLAYIDQKGVWYGVDDIRKSQNGDLSLRAALGEKTFYSGPKKIKPDVILPILHGQNGEDGTVQGFAELMHTPMAGPSLVSSVTTMDKDIAKKLLTAANLPVVDWVVIHKATSYPSYEVVTKHLGKALFIKPASTGSSVGVSKVSSSIDYDPAIQLAFRYSKKIVVEKAVSEAREIEVAVIGNDNPKVTAPGEIIPGQEFYNFNDKYGDASAAVIQVPAQLGKHVADEIQHMALQAYKATEGHGMARVDFFLSNTGQIYINEINTIPGFTNISMYPKLWQHAGLSYAKLIEILIDLGLEGK